MTIAKTKYHSWKLNELTQGCKQCVAGRKLVVFVTGICPKNCFYCPLSEEKKNHDVIFANERQLQNENETSALVEEAKACRAWGAGFTGGDPLVKIERTCRYIKLLKKNFEKSGKRFHIHLYTILESLTEERLKMLEEAGLDELRVHPDIFEGKNWHKIDLLFKKSGSKKYNFHIGVEIPSIPGYEDNTRKLIDYFVPKIDFLNINELEISDTNSCELVDRKFHTKNKTSYGVKGSEEQALRLLKYIENKYQNANVHYCTCKLKDGVQLRERLKLRAENTKKIFDIVSDDGTIIRGVIYLHELQPSFGYKTIIKNVTTLERKRLHGELENTRKKIVKEFSIPEKMLMVDEQKLRIITNIGVVKKLNKHLKSMHLIPAIVEQYPTWDQMEVDVEFL